MLYFKTNYIYLTCARCKILKFLIEALNFVYLLKLSFWKLTAFIIKKTNFYLLNQTNVSDKQHANVTRKHHVIRCCLKDVCLFLIIVLIKSESFYKILFKSTFNFSNFIKFIIWLILIWVTLSIIVYLFMIMWREI